MAKWMVQGRNYEIMDMEKIYTPRLCVFSDRVSQNIEKMKSILESAFPDTGFKHLCAHVKTHKSPDIVKMQRDAGIQSFKASLNEVDMLIDSGVKEIFIAYPLLIQDAEQTAEKIKSNPDMNFLVQAGSLDHVEILNQAALKAGLVFKVMIDLDIGMHRTGIMPEKSMNVYKSIESSAGLEFAGLHGYDGHLHYESRQKRQDEAAVSMSMLKNALDHFKSKAIPVRRLILGGSPSFTHDLSIIKDWDFGETHLQLSPGTWIYWDSGYDTLIPGLFEMAALILAQVVETSGGRRITLNLGHKRWGADQGPVNCFSIPDAQVVSFSEEHTVLEHDGSQSLKTGDYVLLAPRHVCSTVNLWEYFVMIAGNGRIINSRAPVSARNR
jgi:D-serine deaminase-like pyridoxal phosphate-dependent protein